MNKVLKVFKVTDLDSGAYVYVTAHDNTHAANRSTFTGWVKCKEGSTGQTDYYLVVNGPFTRKVLLPDDPAIQSILRLEEI